MDHRRAAPGSIDPVAAATAAGLLAVLLASFPYFEQVRNANELPRIVQAMALVDEGSFAVDGPARRGVDLGPDLARSPKDGRLYPNKPPGVSILGAVAYVLARLWFGPSLTLRGLTWFVRLLAASLPMALAAYGITADLRRRRAGPMVVPAVLAVFLGTPLFAYGRLAYGHALAASCLAVGIVQCARALDEEAPGRAVFGGFAAGAAVAADYGAVFAAAPIGAVLVLWNLRPRACFVAAGALVGALVPVGALALYHHHVFGSPLSTGYHAVITPAFAAKHARGIVLGLSRPTVQGVVRQVLDPGFGWLVWAPLTLPALAGLAHAAWRPGPMRSLARIHLGMVVVYVLVIAGLAFDGGWRVGPRYAVTAMPGLCAGVVALFDPRRDGPGRAALAVVAATAVFGWVVNGLAAALWPHFDPAAVRQPVVEVLLPLLRDGYAPYGLPGAAHLVPAAVVLVGLGLAARATGGRRPPAPPGPTHGRWPLVAGAVLGLSGVGALWAVPRHPRSAAHLAYVERVYEPPRVGRPPPSRRLSP